MVWKNLSTDRATVVDKMTGFVTALVAGYRRRGMKAEHARETVARHLRVSPRRVRSYLYNEVQSVPAHEAIAIAEGWARAQAALEAEISHEREKLRGLKTQCEAVTALFSAHGDSGR